MCFNLPTLNTVVQGSLTLYPPKSSIAKQIVMVDYNPSLLHGNGTGSENTAYLRVPGSTDIQLWILHMSTINLRALIYPSRFENARLEYRSNR